MSGLGGNDWLEGGRGNDLLTGGAGADTFMFSHLGKGCMDRITDFDPALDTIALSKAVFGMAGPIGALSAGAFWEGSRSHDSSDRIIYNSDNGTIFYDPDGTGSAAAVRIAIVPAGTDLSHADFIIV